MILDAKILKDPEDPLARLFDNFEKKIDSHIREKMCHKLAGDVRKWFETQILPKLAAAVRKQVTERVNSEPSFHKKVKHLRAPILPVFRWFCSRGTRENVIDPAIRDIKLDIRDMRERRFRECFVRFIAAWHSIRCIFAVMQDGLVRSLKWLPGVSLALHCFGQLLDLLKLSK